MKLTQFTLAGTVLFLALNANAANLWEKIKAPVEGAPTPIGTYNNGCIIGAQPLPLNGTGYQVIRKNRNRYYGHPDMIAYLERLGKKVQQAGLPTMLVGDIGMPAGGRFTSGHASHQMGLDADIWLRMGRMSDKDANNSDGKGLLVVNHKLQRVDDNVWSSNHAKLIKLAVEDPQVARIFVNPAIKLKLCQTAGNDRAWLRKVRLAAGHDSHFHVRLTCPQGAQYCQNQGSIPAGDGCGAELWSWFEPAKPSAPTPKPEIIMPTLCEQVLVKEGLN